MYDKALEINPHDALMLTSKDNELYKGIALERLNKLDDAIEMHDRALQINPISVYTYVLIKL